MNGLNLKGLTTRVTFVFSSLDVTVAKSINHFSICSSTGVIKWASQFFSSVLFATYEQVNVSVPLLFRMLSELLLTFLYISYFK